MPGELHALERLGEAYVLNGQHQKALDTMGLECLAPECLSRIFAIPGLAGLARCHPSCAAAMRQGCAAERRAKTPDSRATSVASEITGKPLDSFLA